MVVSRVFRAAAAAVVLLPLTAWPQESSPLPPIEHRRLGNGLDVVVLPDHAAPFVSVAVAVRTGSFTQQSGQEGLAHLYEHLLFRAYGTDASSFWADVSRLRGVFNGFTSEEAVAYFVQVPAKNFDPAIRILGKLLANPRWDAKDLNAERPVVLDELFRDASDPEQRLERQVAARLWGHEWPRKDVGGDSASVKAITIGALRDAYARYYIPNNVALIVTGDVDPAAVMESARGAFENWRPGPDPFADAAPAPLDPLDRTSAVLIGGPVGHATILVMLQGPSARDTASARATEALCAIINQPGSAFQRRLTGSGLFQSLRFSYQRLIETGPIAITGRAAPEHAARALYELLGELDRLDALEGLGEDDLARARKHQQLAAALDLEQMSSLAPTLATWWSSATIEEYFGGRGRPGAGRAPDLRRVAATYIAIAPRVIGVLGPGGVLQAVAGVLRGEVPPPGSER